MRRSNDVIRPGNHRSNIMMLNPIQSSAGTSVGSYPFCYASVLGIFHANVFYLGQHNEDLHPRRIDFLWVRWYDLKKAGSWTPQRLDEVHFSSASDDGSFGFLDPGDILRACHIIPSFKEGNVFTKDGEGFSQSAQDKNDWNVYFVNR